MRALVLLLALSSGCAGPCGWACKRVAGNLCLRSARWVGGGTCACGVAMSPVSPVERLEVNLKLAHECTRVRGTKGCE